jgi:integrase
VKVGRTYRFFKKRLIDALLQQTAGQVARTNQVSRYKIPEVVRNEERSEGMGNKKTGRSRRRGKRRAFRSFFKSVDSSLEVTALHKRDVLSHLSKEAEKRSGYAANKERKNLVAAWNWAVQYIPHFPAKNPFLVDRFPEVRSARYVPPEKDFWTVYKVASSEQDKLMLLCYLHLAARRNEIFNLRKDDVDFEGKRIRLYTRKRKDGSLHYDWLPLTNRLFKKLSDFLPGVSGEWILTNPQSKLPFVARQHWLPRICKKAGVKQFGLHAVRHLSASILINNKISLIDVQTILRHKNMITTQRYIHRLESVRHAVDVFD